MKKILSTLLLGGALLPTLVFAQVRETPAVLVLVEGGNPQGYVQNSNDEGLVFSTSQGGAGQLVAYSKINGDGLNKEIRFAERNELLAGPRAQFSAGSFNEAAEAFGKVARDYAFLLGVPQNFASEALYYQIESLKRAGNYGAMGALVNSPAGASIEKKLTESFVKTFALHKLWALYGSSDFAGLKAALQTYEEPVPAEKNLLKTPNFKKLPSSEVSQLAFLRGKVFDSEGDKEKALEDFYRSFTLAYGNDVLLAKLSMGAAMVIHKADPTLEKGSKTALSEMQSLAYLYSLRFGKETMPADFQPYAVRPVLPKRAPAAEATDAPAPEGAPVPEGAPAPEAKKDEGDGAPAKAEDKAEEPKKE